MSDSKPGSDGAISKGCTCPVIDNGHGCGYMGQPDIFVISGDCSLHGLGSETDFLPMRTDAESMSPVPMSGDKR